jgi:hypothetical protein
MKIVKIEINKERKDGKTKMNYPAGFIPTMNPFIYQDEAGEEDANLIEYCLATVADNFIFTDKMVELTQAEAEQTISNWVDANKNHQNKTIEELTEIKEKRLACLN